MKRFLLVWLALALGLTGPAAAEPTRYQSPDRAFTIVYPEGWGVFEPQGSQASPAVVAAVHPGGEMASKVLVRPLARGVTLAEHVKAFKAEAATRLSNYAFVAEGQGQVDGNEALWLLFDEDGGAVRLRDLAWFVARDGRVFEIYFASVPPEKMEERRPCFEEILASFKFAAEPVKP